MSASSQTMNVVIALASSSGQLSGVQRHALNLASCLLTRPEIAEVHLVAAPWQQSFLEDAGLSCNSRLHLHAAPIGNSFVSRNLWFYSGLPSLASRLNADIVHLAYPAPLRRRAFACPVVVTLHDLYPYDIPKNFGFPKVFFNRAILRQCLSQSDAIACVSASTLARLKIFNERLAQNKARVLFNAVQFQGSPTANVPLSGPPNFDPQHPFLLCVAQHRRNKNILLALRTFERLLRNHNLKPHTRLLIVGIPGPETPTIQDFIAKHGLARQVLLLNGIPEAQLQWCYRNCAALLAPSTIEGFGLPIAEAHLAGCPIVCTDIPAFQELAGDGCHFFSLGQMEEEGFATAVLTALNHPRPKPANLPQFSADAIGLYRSLSSSSVMGYAPLRSSLDRSQESHHRP